MRQLKYIVLLASISLFSSCLQTDGLLDNVTTSEDVLLDLKCVAMGTDEVIVTKAWEDATAAEQYIRDLRVYIFSTSGSLVGYSVFGNAALTDNNDYGYWRTLQNIPTKTGNVHIYAVANLTTSQYSLADEDLKLLTNIDPLDLSGSELTLTAFRNIKFNRTRDGLNPLDERFMMVGSVNDGNPVTIGRGTDNAAIITNPTTAEGTELRLYRILSKNTINISRASDITFTLTSYGLFNVPNGGALVKTSDHTASFNTSYPNEFYRLLSTDQNQLSFYLPENMAGAGQNITGWQDRETNSYSTGEKVFTNAPEGSTYLLLRGNYTGLGEQNREVEASVEYTIHLGDFGSNLSDFNVERNYSYVYNVTINGVDDITVEAKKEGDRPAAEGIVLEKADANSVIEVDCHYEARAMSFTKEEVAKDAENGLMLRLETPFGTSRILYVRADGVYDGPTGEGSKLCGFTADGKIDADATDFSGWIEEGDELDYNWLHFVKNTTNNRMTTGDAETNVAKYPGDNNERGGSLADGTAHMDVFSFLHQLVVDATATNPTVFFTDDDTQHVTCFIDENYYPDRSWAEYVNKEEGRTAFFLTKEFHVSTDNKSIYTVIKYAIKQKSIWTFYNPAMAETVKAFGVESVSEETISNNKDNTITTGRDDENGFTAAKTYQSGQYFYTGSLDARPKEQNQYTTKLKACMSRNRDSNGNEEIDENEIRWYLATINQYKGLSVGMDVIPVSSRLFDINTMQNFAANISAQNLGEYHYYTASEGSNAIYWAEEVVSTSVIGGGFFGFRDYGFAKHVRCVRTLTSGGDGEEDSDTFYDNSSVRNIVDLSRVHPEALRGYQNGGFPTHYETEGQNKLYTWFEIAASRLPNQYNYAEIKGTETRMLTAEEDICQQELGGAWRVPNSRELSLMLIALEDDNTFINQNHWASTRFNGNRYGNNGAGYKPFSGYKGFGYWSDSGNSYRMTIEPTANNGIGYVRCVRDVQVGEAQGEYENGGSLIN